MKGGNEDMYEIWNRLSYQSIINIATWLQNNAHASDSK